MRVLVQDSSKGQLIVEVSDVNGQPPATISVEVTGPPARTEEMGTFNTGGVSYEVFARSPQESAHTVEAVYRLLPGVHPSEAERAGTIAGW